MTTVGSIRAVLDAAYPPHLAESWDSVGLICGDPADEVSKVAFALDCTQAVAEAAVACGAHMLVVHHPLLLRGVDSVAADTPKGKVIHTLLRAGVALFAAHTNADSARPGVNDELALLLGLTPGRPILAKNGAGMDQWSIYAPTGEAPAVAAAMFAAGAGDIGEYSECSFSVEGSGQFRPLDNAHPTIGDIGEVAHVDETQLTFVAPARIRRQLLGVLREVHPYEEPAFAIVEMADTTPLEKAYGLGRVCTLEQPLTLAQFTQRVADALPETEWGVRAAGDPDALIRTVALSSGSGDSFLDAVRGLGVDCYLTSDLRHHPVDEYLRAGGPAVIDTAHWASEFPWTRQAARIVEEQAGVQVEVLELRTDPWTISAHPRQ